MSAPVDETVLDAAARVIARDGLASATADAIAKEAGINRVTLYRRGLSPAGLAAALAARTADALQAHLWPAMTASGSGRERLEFALDGLCDAAEAHLGFLAALFDGATAVFHVESGVEMLTRIELVDPLRRLLEDGLADGSIRELDPDEVAEVLFNQVGWTYVHLRRSHAWPPERARRAVVSLAVAGVAASAPAPGSRSGQQ